MRRFVLLVLCGLSWSTASAADAQLSPAMTNDVVCVVDWNGEESWTAYQKTAAYQAFFESGLVPALVNQISQFSWIQILASVASEAELPKGIKWKDLSDVLKPAWTNGGILALCGQTHLESMSPYLLLVIRDGAIGYPTVSDMVKSVHEKGTQESEIAGHKVLICSDDNSEAACWTEGNDLIFFFGFEVNGDHARVEVLLSAAAGDQLSQQTAWSESWSEEPVPTDSFRLWVNLQKVLAFCRQTIGDPDGFEPIQKVLSFTGIDQWQSFAFGSGCHGKHVIHQWSLRANQSPLQFIGWGDQTVSLDQLPPLPADVCSFSLQVVDLKNVFQRLTELQTHLAADPDQVVNFLNDLGLSSLHVTITKPEDQAEQMKQAEIALSALEPVVCLYNDRKQQILPIGIPTVAIKVKDQAVLLAQLEKLHWKRDDRWGCPTFYITTNPLTAQASVSESKDDVTEDDDATDEAKREKAEHAANNVTTKLNTSLGTMTIALCDGWLVCGIQPQTVQTFILRSQGKLPRWTPDKIAPETRAKLPARFARLTYDDPRAGIETLASMAPWLRDGMQTLVSAVAAATEIEIMPAAAEEADGPGAIAADFNQQFASPLDIPPVELVVAPLFPNVSVTTVHGNITRERTYGSTFMQNPVLWTVAGYFALTILIDLL